MERTILHSVWSNIQVICLFILTVLGEKKKKKKLADEKRRKICLGIFLLLCRVYLNDSVLWCTAEDFVPGIKNFLIA